jgi:hypothetical protein
MTGPGSSSVAARDVGLQRRSVEAIIRTDSPRLDVGEGPKKMRATPWTRPTFDFAIFAAHPGA